MPSSSHPVERFSFSTALFGMLVLTLGMGLGRFLYTPMLPVMMAEGAFSFSQLSWIASGNYAGYLAGSLLFSFGAFHQPSRLRPFLLVSALASGLLILAMAWLPPFILVLLIRFLAGVASAGMLIFGSTLIMQHTRHPFVLAALFSGVGIGIALGNEYVLAGLHFALSSQTLWQGAGALSGMMLIALTLLMPSKKHAIAPMPLAKTEQQIMSWWLLAILYGLAGFGYIIVATYLPLMAKDAGRFVVLNFDDRGTVTHRAILGETCTVLEMAAGTWHAVLSLDTGGIIFEVKHGGYQPVAADDYAHWAPAEGEPGTTELMAWYAQAQVGDSTFAV